MCGPFMAHTFHERVERSARSVDRVRQQVPVRAVNLLDTRPHEPRELDGSDAVEAHYAILVQPGETIVLGAGRRVRVVDVVPVDEEDSPFVGLLRVESV